ncbi:DMT family transporter [Pasteurellaceae bacterium LIM206]|nr:DMT family transporter [Pasteurellaceae bacterium LIM206]
MAQEIQRPFVGFAYALTATLLWGLLPIALHQVLQAMDAETTVWYRFIVTAVSLFIFLAIKRKLPALKHLHRRDWLFVLLGIMGLTLNFFLYNLSLQYIPATASQILSPIGSFVMMSVGVLLFKDKFGRHQKIGLVSLLGGLVLFFNDRVEDFLQLNTYFVGVVLMIIATSTWVFYGIAQKMLGRRFQTQEILLFICTGSAVLCWLVSAPGQITRLNGFQLGCLIFCCANTVIAYGCYGESLKYWEVSKSSVVMTQIPVFTMLFSVLLSYFLPDYFAVQPLNWISYLGAFFVVAGALFAAIGYKFIKR